MGVVLQKAGLRVAAPAAKTSNQEPQPQLVSLRENIKFGPEGVIS